MNGPKSNLDSTPENVRTVLQWMLISGQQEIPMADLYGTIPVIYRQAREDSVFKVMFSILCDFLVTRARNGRAPAVASIAQYGHILEFVRAQLRDAERIENINEVLLTILSINSIEVSHP
ncbi:hypothetical protein N7453_002146 [Penicillium expansum]|nr:hypothetical protein N7453_002146 [Penicillium expansum]